MGEDRIVYFLTIEKARFRKPVRPGRHAADAGQGAAQARAGVEILGRGLCRRRAMRRSGIQRHDPRTKADGDGEFIRRRSLRTAPSWAPASRSALFASSAARSAGRGRAAAFPCRDRRRHRRSARAVWFIRTRCSAAKAQIRSNDSDGHAAGDRRGLRDPRMRQHQPGQRERAAA